MKRIGTLGLIMAAVFAMCAAAASTASAVQWLDNGNPISSELLVLSTGTLLLWDLASPGGGTAVICTGDNHGTVGPGDLDLVLSIVSLGCVFDTGKAGACETGTLPSANAVHLPWHTLLLTVGGVTRDMIENSGAGDPGWEVKCKVPLLGTVTDECTSPAGDPKITNNATDVTETFEASETAKCSLGNANSGMVVGGILIFSDVANLHISTG